LRAGVHRRWRWIINGILGSAPRFAGIVAII